MSGNQDQQSPQDRALAIMARRLHAADFEKLSGEAVRETIRYALTATIQEVYGAGTIRPDEGLAAWGPFSRAVEQLDMDLTSFYGQGVLSGYFAGGRPGGVQSWESIFRDATMELFAAADRLAKGM